MSTIAVVPGSFDPLTLGHLDVITRAARLFDEVHVLVVHNPAKSAFIDAETRVRLIEEAVSGAPALGPLGSRISVRAWSSGLLADYCRSVGAAALVKGIRSQLDLSYETPMALVNRDLAGVETVFVLPDPANATVSSSLVRQVAALGGAVGRYVPANVDDYLRSR